MVLFQALGTSCFDVYQLINICIPTLTKEVVKQSQNTTVNKISTAVSKIVAFAKDMFTPAVSVVPAFA